MYTVNIFESAFSSPLELFMTIGHEYVHLANCILGNKRTKFQEFAAYMWEAGLYEPGSIGHLEMGKRAFNHYNPFRSVRRTEKYADLIFGKYMNFNEWGMPSYGNY